MVGAVKARYFENRIKRIRKDKASVIFNQTTPVSMDIVALIKSGKGKIKSSTEIRKMVCDPRYNCDIPRLFAAFDLDEELKEMEKENKKLSTTRDRRIEKLNATMNEVVDFAYLGTEEDLLEKMISFKDTKY